MFDSEAVLLLVFADQLIVHRKDIGPIACYDTINLFSYLVLIERPFEALVPAFRFDLALGINLGRSEVVIRA